MNFSVFYGFVFTHKLPELKHQFKKRLLKDHTDIEIKKCIIVIKLKKRSIIHIPLLEKYPVLHPPLLLLLVKVECKPIC